MASLATLQVKCPWAFSFSVPWNVVYLIAQLGCVIFWNDPTKNGILRWALFQSYSYYWRYEFCYFFYHACCVFLFCFHNLLISKLIINGPINERTIYVILIIWGEKQQKYQNTSCWKVSDLAVTKIILCWRKNLSWKSAPLP